MLCCIALLINLRHFLQISLNLISHRLLGLANLRIPDKILIFLVDILSVSGKSFGGQD